ncbi:MAG: hypothetical protein J0M34_06750 [Alphaproteobacteria bacterium]|nr:hypothetical protein [Alphaproteobacteria bacterium]
MSLFSASESAALVCRAGSTLVSGAGSNSANWLAFAQGMIQEQRSQAMACRTAGSDNIVSQAVSFAQDFAARLQQKNNELG